AGAGVAVGGRSVSFSPLARVTETNNAPGSPVFCGCPTTVTLSPGFKDVALHPARINTNGAVISTFQVSTPPLSLGTSNSIQEWGLAHLNCLTVPTSVTFLSRSKPSMEWCAEAGPAIHSPMAQVHAINNLLINSLSYLLEAPCEY